MPVAAYHIILANYGFWLPNDPRGLGPIMFARGNCSLPAGRQPRLTCAALSPPPAMIIGAACASKRRLPGHRSFLQGSSAGCWYRLRAIRGTIRRVGRCVCDHAQAYACGRLASGVPSRAGRQLAKRGGNRRTCPPRAAPLRRFPLRERPTADPLVRKQWICFLNREEDIRQAIEYVERNPRKEGLRPQRWSFVISYHGHELAVGQPGDEPPAQRVPRLKGANGAAKE